MDQSRNIPFVIAMSVILIPIGLMFYYYTGSAQAGFTSWLSALIICVAVEYFIEKDKSSGDEKITLLWLKTIALILIHGAILVVFPWNTKWRLIFIPGPFVIADGIFVFWVMRSSWWN